VIKLKLLLINNSNRPAHIKHLDAIRQGCASNNIIITKSILNADVVYVQSTSPKNILIGLLLFIIRKPVYFYYHEPCFFKEKLQKKNAIFYSLAVKIVQAIEVFLFDNILVSTKVLVRKTRKIHPIIFKIFKKKTIMVVPLIICDPINSNVECISDESTRIHPRRTRLLFLGRAVPDQRYFWLFQELSSKLKNVEFLLLTKDSVDLIKNSKVKILSADGKPFTEKQRLEALEYADVVWTPYEFRYNQSGVVPDALSFGCSTIVSYYEKDKALRNQKFNYTLGRDIEVEQLALWLNESVKYASKNFQDSRAYFTNNHSPARLKTLFDAMRTQVSR